MNDDIGMKFVLPPFSKLLTSEILNTTSSSVLTITTPLIAIIELKADAMAVGILAACSTGAPLLFGLSAGALADRCDRKKTLFWCGIARLLLVVVAAILACAGKLNIAVLCAFSFAISMIKLLFDSVVVAVIPTIVAKTALSKANSWYEAGNSSAYALGPAIGGWILQSMSSTAVYLFNALLYFFSTVFVKNIALPATPPPSDSDNSHLVDIAEGVKLLWRNEVQRFVALAAGSFNFFHTAFFTVFTLYALQELDFNASSLGAIISLVGLAGLFGAMLAPGLITVLGVRAALIVSLLIIGPLGLPILFAENLPFHQRMLVVACCLAAWDFLIVVHLIVEQTIRQTSVDNRHLSRITATTRFISWGADPIGALCGGMLAASAVGSRASLFICLAGFVFSALILLLSKQIRNLNESALRIH